MAWFDVHAADYDAWYATELGRYTDDVEKQLIADLAELRAGQVALDVGCGTGHHTVWLAGQGLRVAGLDESRAMLAVAQTKSGELPVEWVMARAETMPFADDSFDLVVGVASLEFVADPGLVLHEAVRVLRPGGRLVLGVLNRDSPWGRLYRQAARDDPGSVFAAAHLLGEDEVRALLGSPCTVRKGLYHPPDPALDRHEADLVEARQQASQADGAGFLAVRWVKEES